MSSSIPDSMAALRPAIEAQRQKVRKAAREQIKKIEAERKREEGRLDAFEASLAADVTARPGRRSRRGSGSASRRRPSPQQAASERREAVFRYALEKGRAVASTEICADLKLSKHEAGTALRRLVEEGRLARSGTGRGTRYTAKGGQALRARIVETVVDRGFASSTELAQALGEPHDAVVAACDALVHNGSIQLTQRDGRPVYLARRTA